MIGFLEATSVCFCQIAICKNTGFANALAAGAVNCENVSQLIQNAKLVQMVCSAIHEKDPHWENRSKWIYLHFLPEEYFKAELKEYIHNTTCNIYPKCTSDILWEELKIDQRLITKTHVIPQKMAPHSSCENMVQSCTFAEWTV